MDEHDEHEAEDPYRSDAPTERVRIIGAEPAAVLAGDSEPGDGEPGAAESEPELREERYLGFVHDTHHAPGVHASGTHAPPPPPAVPPPPAEVQGQFETPAPVAPELPHWTDPPTGQVPAILSRGEDEGGGPHDTGPVWREHEHEWEDSGFEPAMLADDETRVGVLEETPVEERRPWEFDDLTGSGTEDLDEVGFIAPSADDGAGVAPGEPSHDEPGAAGASWWEEGAQLHDAERLGPPATDVLAPEPTVAHPIEPAPAPPAPSADPFAPPAAEAPVPGIPAASTPSPVPARPRSGPRRRPPVPPPPTTGGARNVPVAVATGVGLAAVALGCFAAGTAATLALAAVIVTLASAECYAAFRRAGLRPATLLGLVATVAVMVSAYTKGTAALPLVLVLVVVTSMIWYLAGAERGAPLEGISATVLGFAWVGLLGSFAGLLLAPSIYPQRHGIAFLFGAVVATVGEDVGALVVGSWLGRHQLAPHVSPNKTWEGLAGGAVVAVVASALITGHVHPWTPGKAAILGVVAAVVAPVGDLCESLVKRDLGLKDMGSLLPGHGGVLDRVDALLFVLPATYYLVRVLNLG